MLTASIFDNCAYKTANKQMTDYLDDNLFEDRIDISERTDLTKNNKSKECIICHYLFFNIGFKFQCSVCNCCHVVMTLRVSISRIAIITIKNLGYRCIVNNISISEAIKLLESAVLKNHWYIYKKYCLDFQPIQDSLFTFFV